MKKNAIALLAALLTALCAASAAPAASFKSFGVSAEVPEGWKTRQGEQVLIYNRSESAAVIIDQVAKTRGESAESVAGSLAEAVGVKKQDIRRDPEGALSMEFVQNGEPVGVRVIDEDTRVLMVYSFGGDAETGRIARSVGRAAGPPAPGAVKPERAEREPRK